jgi:hypothetical protein
MTITAIFLSSLIILFWLIKFHQPKGKKRVSTTGRPAKQHSRYQAVAIKAGACSCTAVKQIKGMRYLSSNEVPHLPLPECNQTTCACRYVHYEDRRLPANERRAAYSMQTELYGLDEEKDRRTSTGRRASDRAQGSAMDEDYGEIQWTT